MKGAPFFVGWMAPPRGLRGFLWVVATASVLAFCAAALVTAATQNDPGSGAFRWDWGAQTLTGTLSDGPSPILHVEGEGRFSGRSILLSNPGKRGIGHRVDDLLGTRVRATGIMLARGDLLMMQVRGNQTGLQPAEGVAAAPPIADLGRWRLTGEICDGKCYAGAMRPGTGLAHKACANLCIVGGVPAVFVSTAPVEGATVFLLGDASGQSAAAHATRWSAARVALSGRVERRGGMPVFLAEFDSIAPAP
ncbi:MAG: hypothetical protein AAF318_18310 [Pseudomonadota bacterium]